MYKVWFERPPLSGYESFIDGLAEAIAPDLAAPDPYDNIAEANAILAGTLPYTAEVMDKVANLQVIARAGIGVDSVDLQAATARGIKVVNAPDAPTIPTAEQTLMLILAVAKNLKQCERRLRAGETELYKRHTSFQLEGKTLGLLGFGRIARRVARAAQALDMTVISFDPYTRSEDAAAANVELVNSFNALLAAADVLSLHAPSTPETRKIMNQAAFATMKPGSIFVNAARGTLVDETALAAAIQSGHLFGAGLDVTDPEPPQLDNPLLAMENVLVVPHVASATPEGKRGNFEGALKGIVEVLRGEQPTYLVNPEVIL